MNGSRWTTLLRLRKFLRAPPLIGAESRPNVGAIPCGRPSDGQIRMIENQPVIPRLRVTRTSKASFELDDDSAWENASFITPLWLADGSAPATQATRVRVCFDGTALYVRFDCDDRDIWGTYTQRDEPIYDEEVVEVFLAGGADDPHNYFEFQVSPNGVLFDTTVSNPLTTRDAIQWDIAWNCPDIRWQAARNDSANQWWGAFAIPWRSISPDGKLPPIARADFFRIERPHDAEPEYSCWSPTLTNPADFHKPGYFGILEFDS
jgi:hypothetical protein